MGERKLDFIGIGVTRAGTTWTWFQLQKHPQFCNAGVKETTIFLKKNPERFLRRYTQCSNRYFVGEYTPWYIYNRANVIDKIKKYSPDAKLLVIFRNPVDRIFTQYKAGQWRKYRKVTESFNEWFNNPNNAVRYINGNLYMKWLPLWCDAFSEGQIKVDFYEDLTKDPLSYIQGVFHHIGMDSTFVPSNYWVKEKKAYNKYYDKNPIEMSLKNRKLAQRFYEKSIINLQNYTGRDLSVWLE